MINCVICSWYTQAKRFYYFYDATGKGVLRLAVACFSLLTRSLLRLARYLEDESDVVIGVIIARFISSFIHRNIFAPLLKLFYLHLILMYNATTQPVPTSRLVLITRWKQIVEWNSLLIIQWFAHHLWLFYYYLLIS